MKHAKLLSVLILTLGLPAVARSESTLTQAQITQIIKDVKTIDPGKGERAAVMKETLQGEQALRTGIDSRAELLFNDHTITRLGANTHFSFTEGTRNMSLQSGVMLLQVPKGIGGAKIETAAVTAAVTGTTIMVEAGKNYTKLIVLEGECCLWPKNDQKGNKVFKFKHKTCALAGQEIILRNGSKTIPDPVYVNLNILESTSLLLTGPWNSPLNTTPINNAANGQGPGTYVPTNLAIIGAGTDVTVIQGQLPPPGGSPPPPGSGAPPFTPPGKYGPLNTIPGHYGIGGGTTINTDPRITNGGVTSYGRVYRGTILDGQPIPYIFGPGSGVSFPNLQVDSDFPNYGVAAFKFGSLDISGMPVIQMSGNGATELALVSVGAINISNATPATVDFSNLNEVDLFTAGGNIDIGPGITITDLDRLELYSYGTSNNITVDGTVNTTDKFYATTQGNYTENGDINTNNVIVQAGGALTENGNITASSDIELQSQGVFGGSGFLSAPQITLQGGGPMTLTETDGDVTTDDVNGVQLDMNALQTLSITGNGINVPNGFTGESAADEDDEDPPTVDLTLTSLDNGVTGSGTINLSNGIYVDNFTATADSDITVNSNANIQSNNSIQLTSNNGGIEVDGQLDAQYGSLTITAANDVTISASASLNSNNGTQITSNNGNVDIEGSVYDNDFVTVNAAGNITTGSDSSVSGADGDGAVSFTSTGGTNSVTIDGDITASTINITGYDVHTLSTLEDAGIYGNTSITINAANNVTLDGYLQTPTLTVTGIGNNGSVPANVTIPTTSNIIADNIYINAGIVDMEGFATGDLNGAGNEDGFGSNIFSVNTTGGTGPLTDNGGSMQDFYSLSGSGTIDSGTVQVTSRGDLILGDVLGEPESDEASDPTVNNVDVDPYGDLYELDLSGATVEVPYGYTNIESTLNLTANSGNITIGGDIDLGTDNEFASTFTATALNGNIAFEDEYSVTADNVTLTAQQITSPSDPTINSGNISLGVSEANVNLTQDSEFADTFYFSESGTGSDGPPVGSLTLNFNSTSDPVLSVSANSLTVGNIDASSFDSFTLSLSSAWDINGGSEPSSATITAATSVALQVGVAATLAGDNSSNIDYNGTQLIIDDTDLNYFSLTASSIAVNAGFPTLENASLNLTATGANGITVSTSLDTPNGYITLDAQNGDVTLSGSLTTGGGNSINVTGNNINANVGATISTGSAGGDINLTAQTGDINLHNPVTTGSGGSITLNANTSITAYGGATITTGSGGNFAAYAYGGDIDLYGSIEPNGNLNLNAYEGSININTPALIVGGNFSAYALNNIVFSLDDPSVGGYMTLNAGGAIELDNSISISGSLTLDAGTYIHTPSDSNAKITGATSVTLTLNASAGEISAVTGESNILYFGVPAADEEDGFAPIAIDLTDVISNDSSVSATATSLTLTSDFDEPNISLTLEASSGVLTLNGAVTVSGFNGYAYGGNLVINDAMTTPGFYGYSSGIITGTGTIVAGTVTLQQGGAATLSQPEDGLLSYNTSLAIDLADGETTSLTISASPLTLSSALSLPGIDLTLSGVINTQGNTITALNVTLQNLQTTNVASGSATNLNVNGYSLTLSNVALDGTGSGSGGALVGVTSSGSAEAGITHDEVNLDANDLIINGPVTANGGPSGGNGGSINLTSQDNININGGPVSVDGGSGGVTGGSGGTITLTSGFNTNAYNSITANGGDASPTTGVTGGNGGSINLNSAGGISVYDTISANGGAGNSGSGGNGGTVSLTTTLGGGDIDVYSPITATGGDAGASTGAAGGNGGTVTLNSQGNIDIENNIGATSGVNGNTKWTGGNGGTVNLTALGEITVNSAIEVSSSNLYTNRVSAKGGNINVTSHAATGVAINITDSGQLAALLNQGAPGPGGAITFIADKGGSVAVSGSVRADNGKINIQTGTVDGTGAGGAISLSGANLSADIVKVGSLGANGSLTIGNSTINGDTAIQLYAAGDNGSVIFNGNTLLSGAGLKTIAGSTVTIMNNVFVTVTGGAATVYTNTPNYKGSGGNDSTNGQFIGNPSTTTKPFASRPGF